MFRFVRYLVLLLASCFGEAGAANDAGGAGTFCAAFSECCGAAEYSIDSPPQPLPASCGQVVASGDEVLCGLGLLAVQGDTVGAGGIVTAGLGVCGAYVDANLNYKPPPQTAECAALCACGDSISDADYSATCSSVCSQNVDGPCGSALSYFKSNGFCASTQLDAGRWTGLPPNVGSGPTGDVVGSASTTNAAVSNGSGG